MHRIRALLLPLVLALVLVPGTVARAQVDASRDIDGDGFDDLLVGVPNEGVSGEARAGVVNVIFSNGNRLSAAGDRTLSQAGAMPGKVEAGDLFGAAVELVDIDDDGYADAVIASTGEQLGLAVNAGSFHVINGSRDGLVVSSAVSFNQGGNLPDQPEVDDFFGFGIASGDFDDDGYGDIAVSAPFEDVAGAVDAGAVTVIPGSAQGLDTSRAAVFSQQGPVAGRLEAGDFFGWSLASGDFDDDGYDDLAVGVPGEDHGTREDAGAVTVLYGSSRGITPEGSRSFDQGKGVANRPESNDLFGFAVAASDLSCDGYDDLVVGVPNEVLGDGIVAGLVHVLRGSSVGVVKRGDVRLAQGRGGVAGERDFNQFGASLAAGNFGSGRCGDIAIGAHTTDVGGDGQRLCIEDPDCAREAGAVVVVYGARAWPQIGGTANFTQRGPIGGIAEEQDFFGRTLAALDIDGDGRDDLVVGVPREDIGQATDAGQITILEGSRAGLTSRGDYSLSQRGRINGRPETGDQFSSSLYDANF